MKAASKASEKSLAGVSRLPVEATTVIVNIRHYFKKYRAQLFHMK